MFDRNYWSGQKVLVTGHSGFKGGWLSTWLTHLGAEVAGISLTPKTDPSLYESASIGSRVSSCMADVAELDNVLPLVQEFRPDVVFHLAAQPLVRYSYGAPVETYRTNVMGTVNLLESIRLTGGVKSVVVVTSDKCYENREWQWGYRETDGLGDFDPYSSSKACSELVTATFRKSYFAPERYGEHGCAIGTARAGNVIGGGDWSGDRLLPDIIRAFEEGKAIEVRNPDATRPWQHVLEPLSGYILLAEKLAHNNGRFAEAWNFGPDEVNNKSVGWIVRKCVDLWGEGASSSIAPSSEQPHEATLLKLDCSKAKTALGWYPVWPIRESLKRVLEWHKAQRSSQDMHSYMVDEISAYVADAETGRRSADLN